MPVYYRGGVGKSEKGRVRGGELEMRFDLGVGLKYDTVIWYEMGAFTGIAVSSDSSHCVNGDSTHSVEVMESENSCSRELLDCGYVWVVRCRPWLRSSSSAHHQVSAIASGSNDSGGGGGGGGGGGNSNSRVAHPLQQQTRVFVGGAYCVF